MDNKTKKTKVDYAAIIREYEMYARGRQDESEELSEHRQRGFCAGLCLYVFCH